MKIYEFDIPKTLLSDLDIVIRDKEDIIKVLLHTIKYISFSESKKEISNDCNKIVLVVDKMSRLFFHYEKKIVSFCFPFIVKETDEGLECLFNQTLLDSFATSILLSIFNDKDVINNGIEKLFEKCIDEFSDYLVYEKEDVYYELVNYLIGFEPGYLRYDFDDQNHIKDLHPLKHFDFYYSSNNAVKIGVNDSETFNVSYLMDVVNTKTNCKYLV
ncbi:MAG: hypothetical protein IJL63_06780 [Clostridia bacterium]|nr:hypothetical protein [Clostridia bacterium]